MKYGNAAPLLFNFLLTNFCLHALYRAIKVEGMKISSGAKHKATQRKGVGVLHPKQLLQILSIILAQVHAGNTS